MRCFIGFFGLTRSLPHTAGAIRTGFYEPLRQAGIETPRAGHFNLPAMINNPRSGELGIIPDRAESALLDLDISWVEPQVHSDIAMEFQVAHAFPVRSVIDTEAWPICVTNCTAFDGYGRCLN